MRYVNMKRYPDPIASHPKGNLERFNTFVEINDIVSWDSGPEMGSLGDHGRSYRKANGEELYVAHPYIYAPEQTFQIIRDWWMKWAERRGMVCEVYQPEKGWYCMPDERGPGAACVVIHKPDVEVLMPE